MNEENTRRYERTDTDVLSIRPCPDCGYEIRPGYEHGRIPQAPGSSHVVCSLQRVQLLRKLGPCEQCGVWCWETWVEGLGIVGSGHRFGPDGDNHPARPGAMPLLDMLSNYIDFKGSTS